MADILIDVPDDVLERLRQRAIGNGRKLDEELTSIVIASARSDTAERCRGRPE